MSRRHTILRNNLIFLFREIVSRLRSCDGGVDLPDASSRLLRGVSEGRKVGSLLTAVSGSPAEGGEVAGGEASGLAGGVEGESSASVLSLANGYANMAVGHITFCVCPRHRVSLTTGPSRPFCCGRRIAARGTVTRL